MAMTWEVAIVGLLLAVTVLGGVAASLHRRRFRRAREELGFVPVDGTPEDLRRALASQSGDGRPPRIGSVRRLETEDGQRIRRRWSGP